MKLGKWVILLGALTMLMVGCGGGDKADEIVCEVGWRTDISLDVEELENVTIPDFEVEDNLIIGDMMFNYSYQPGSEVRDRNLKISITPSIGSPNLMNTVYTFPVESGPIDQFERDQGFTGQVSYVNQVSGSITEYICRVSGG